MTRYFHKWRPHPWHGLDLGPKPPGIIHAFIESTPFDYVKYEPGTPLRAAPTGTTLAAR